jgi:hypothetical protein
MENYEGIQGPWMIVQDEEYDEIKIVEVEDYQPGFYTEICEIGQNMQEAHLIAAAPDLLEACMAFMTLFNESDMRPEDESYEVAHVVQTAINKALGKC